MELNMTDETEVLEAEVVQEEAKLDFDPRQIERDMIAAAEARAQDPSEMAATAYSMYIPHYKRAIPKLSTRGLRRVLNYLVLYPLEQDDIKSANEFEKQVMQLVNSLVEAKFIMIMDSYSKNAQAVYDAQNTPLTQEQSDEIADELGMDRTTVTQENA
jgi:hypothetical protein